MNTSGEGKVAIHRWFETGENWASHPWLAERQRQLLDALAGPLVAAPGEFAVPGLGGVLIGEKVLDVNCPDPKARDRHPTILRVVYAEKAPTESRQRELMQQLRAVPLPTAPGPNIALELPAAAEVHSLASGDGFASLPPARRLTVLVGLGVIAVIVAILGLRLLLKEQEASSQNPGLPGQIVNDTRQDRKAPAPVSDDKTLEPIEGEVPYLRERTKQRFLQVLGQAHIYEHPYAVFLKETAERLPDVAATCRSKEEVVRAVRDLLKRLNAELAAADWSLEKLVEAIGRELNYDAWRQKAGRRTYVDREKPLDEPLRRFVERYRQPDQGIQAAAVRMTEALRRWGERDVPSSPLAVIDRFFRALTRPPELPAKLDHVGADFLRRLPLESVAAGRTFDSEDELAASLRHLLYLLDRDFNPVSGRMPASELTDRIVAEMRLREFEKKNKGRHYRDSEPPADIQKLWKTFE